MKLRLSHPCRYGFEGTEAALSELSESKGGHTLAYATETKALSAPAVPAFPYLQWSSPEKLLDSAVGKWKRL